MKNSDEPLVSVVLCFYNEEMFLEETVRSVLSQDYDRWELVLVDDGSTDESTGRAKAYAAEYPEKIIYLDHPYHQNKGMSASRNAGIKKSRGSYVAFLNADDRWLPGKLRYQVELFNTHPEISAILEASLHWTSWRDPKKDDKLIPVGAKEGIYNAPQLMPLLYPLGDGIAPCLSGVMVQRTALRRCIFEELFRGIFQIYEDQSFLCKLYLKEKIFVSATCHHQYRQPPAPFISSVYDTVNYHKVRSYFLYWFKDYLLSQPIRHKSVERLLRKAQMPYREPLLYKVMVDLPQQVRKIFTRLLIRLGILNYVSQGRTQVDF